MKVARATWRKITVTQRPARKESYLVDKVVTANHPGDILDQTSTITIDVLITTTLTITAITAKTLSSIVKAIISHSSVAVLIVAAQSSS